MKDSTQLGAAESGAASQASATIVTPDTVCVEFAWSDCDPVCFFPPESFCFLPHPQDLPQVTLVGCISYSHRGWVGGGRKGGVESVNEHG